MSGVRRYEPATFEEALQTLSQEADGWEYGTPECERLMRISRLLANMRADFAAMEGEVESVKAAYNEQCLATQRAVTDLVMAERRADGLQNLLALACIVSGGTVVIDRVQTRNYKPGAGTLKVEDRKYDGCTVIRYDAALAPQDRTGEGEA